MSREIRVALFLRRIGPYHHARFNCAADGLDLHVVETRPGSEEYPWERPDRSNPQLHTTNSYETHTFDIAPDPEKGWRGRGLRRQIDRVLSAIDPRVIVTTGWADAEYHMILLRAGRQHIPCVVISDSTEADVKRYGPLEWLKRQILREYSAALVAGTRSREYLEKLGMVPDNIFTAWDVVDNDYLFESAGKLKDDPDLHKKYPLPEAYFLCVSRYIPKKNIPALIRSYAGLLETQLEKPPALVILGSGDSQKEIDAGIDSLGIRDSVYQYGFIQYDEIPYFYANALALILPSLYDQWGLVVNEAMAAGLPVFVSINCGCCDDLVKEGGNGFHLDPHDLPGITRKLLLFLSMDRSETEAMRRESLHRIGDYSLGKFRRGLMEAIEMSFGNQGKHSTVGRILLRMLLMIE